MFIVQSVRAFAMRASIVALVLVVEVVALHAQERPISVPLDFLLLNLDSPAEPGFGQTLTVQAGSRFALSLTLTDNPTLAPISTLSMSLQEPAALIDATFSPSVPSGWAATFAGNTLSFQNSSGEDDEILGGVLGTVTFEVDPETIAGTSFFLSGISNVEAEDAAGNSLDAGPGLSPAIRIEVVPEPTGCTLCLLGFAAFSLATQLEVFVVRSRVARQNFSAEAL
jgi:hypothetical protein